MSRKRVVLLIAAFLAFDSVVAVIAVFYALTWRPAPVAPEPVVCPADAPTLRPGQNLRVMSWNVQYMASKNYVFFYDVLDGSGPDERPSPEHIAWTLDEVARVILDVSPDIVLLQEVDDGAARTDGADQLALLLERLGGGWPCQASAMYWKAGYVPHPRIHGAVGMKVSTLSRYKLTQATRHQLALIPSDPVTQAFNLKRAVLEVRAPVQGGPDLVLLNTHLDAFAQGTDTMERQVEQVGSLLDALTAAGNPWIIGGDFNLLPSTRAFERLDARHQAYYKDPTELRGFFDRYTAVPALAEADGPDAAAWFTHFPNDPTVKGPDRTIDYLFSSRALTLGDHWVRSEDTQRISDHLPVVAVYAIP